jgi:PPOX class probable F420-dependent enzyme
VATPVWFAPYRGSYYLFSAGGVGKVKRLRNFSQTRIAACTMRGAVTGDWLDCEAIILQTQADRDIALQALRDKYVLQMRIGDVFAKLSGKMSKRAFIRIVLEG